MKLFNLKSSLFTIALMLMWGFSQAKEVARIPFESRNGSIILTIKLNDFQRPLKFIFDTGADGMALSRQLADSAGLKTSHVQTANVVGGTQEVAISMKNQVHMGSFTFKDQNIAIFNQFKIAGIDGILGNTLAKAYIVEVDYDSKTVVLHNPDEPFSARGKVVPFNVNKGIFLVDATLNLMPDQPHIGNFVFDTGAHYGLICFRPFVRKNKLLISGFKPTSQSATMSMGVATPTFSGKASSLLLGKGLEIKDLDVTLMAGSGSEQADGRQFDGSVGINFISQYNFTINLPKKEIYLVPNKANQTKK